MYDRNKEFFFSITSPSVNLCDSNPFSCALASIPALFGTLVSINGLYLVPAVINLTIPEEYNPILPIFDSCHKKNSTEFNMDVINDGTCISQSCIAFPTLIILYATALPLSYVETSVKKAPDLYDSALKYCNNEITNLYLNFIDSSSYAFEGY